MREEFPDSVKFVIADRVGNVCSNPDCRAVTTGPQLDPTKALNVGVAAHITAASADGPRHDPTLTPAQRRSALNAIWLCQTCAKLIDNDVARFPVELVRSWKQRAEEEAFHRIGKTSAPSTQPAHSPLAGLRKHMTIRIRPVIPSEHEEADFKVQDWNLDSISVEKLGSGHRFPITATWVHKVYDATGSFPAILVLDGRLQWISRTGTMPGTWRLIPGPAASGQEARYGIERIVSVYDPEVAVLESFGCQWIPRRVVPSALAQGLQVFYAADGRCLRMAEDNRILLTPNP